MLYPEEGNMAVPVRRQQTGTGPEQHDADDTYDMRADAGTAQPAYHLQTGRRTQQ